MNKRLTLPILTFCALALAIGYLLFCVPDCMSHPTVCFQSNALAPFRYRILQPLIEHTLTSNGTNADVLWIDFILQALLSPLLMVGLYKWLKRWTNDDKALISVLLFTGVMLMSYHFTMRAISTTIEAVCIVWTLVYIERFWVVGILTIIASLNRETGLVIPTLYVVYHFDSFYKPDKSLIGWTLIAYSGLMMFAIHYALGSAPSVLGLVETFQYNLVNATDALMSNLLFIPLVIVLVLSFKALPPVLKRLAIVAALYCGAIIIGGSWNETLRLCLPILAIALPMMVYDPQKVVEAKWILMEDHHRGEVATVRYIESVISPH